MKVFLPEGANRVQKFLRSRNLDTKVEMLLESTATARDAAKTLNVELHQIGKSIVLGNETNTIVAIVCGDQRVNVNRLSEELNLNNLKPLERLKNQYTG